MTIGVEGIEQWGPELGEFGRISPQMLAGIGETAPASVDNRRRRPSGKYHGEPTHL
jgi:hypothetical protein